MKKWARKVLGDDGYVRVFGYLGDIYQSVFLPIKEEGTPCVRRLIMPGDTVFDVGANVGRFASLASGLVGKTGRVYSFEPLGYARMILTQMKAVRMLDQLTVVPAALSDEEGELTMAIPLLEGWKPKTAQGYLDGDREEPHRLETVRVSTMDEFCRRSQIQRLDFVKVDVEGAEIKMFTGAAETIQKFLPIIYCEIDKLCCDRNNLPLRAAFDHLAQYGYQAWLPDENKKLFLVDPDAIPREKTEYFFIPESRKEKLAADFFRQE